MQPAKLTKIIIGSTSFALVIALVTAALTVYGIIDAGLARVLLFLAWFIAVGGVATSKTVRSKPRNRAVLIGLSFAIIFGGSLIWLDQWAVAKKKEQDARTAPANLPRWMLQPPAPPDIAFAKPPKRIILTVQTGDIRAGNNSVIAPGATQRSEGNLSPNIVGNDNPVGNTQNPTAIAPNGIANAAPNLGTQTVNNYAPPQPQYSFTEEVITPLPASGDGEKIMKIHISPDRPAHGAVIGIIFSGPMEAIEGNDMEFSPKSALWNVQRGQLQNKDGAIPNSLGITFEVPAVFLPSERLIVRIKLKTDIHVLQIFAIGQP
jgi:hypothetical protein